jgi:aminoglycoside phosphotransferase (APT) family kinase protein
VALTVQRDEAALRAGLERWLGRPVRRLARPAPGLSCETVVVDRELVVRLPPLGEGIFPTWDLGQQAAVQEAAGAAGVPVARPAVLEEDEGFLGAPFVAMPFVDGPIPADFTPADPWLAGLPGDEARRQVWESYVDAIVAVHRTPTGGLGLRTGLEAELDAWDGYVRWATDGDPPAALVEVLAWCRDHRPAGELPAGLLWGDVRLGNVVFDPDGLRPRAVLDWDLAAVGPIEMDLAWHLALEGVQAELTGMSVPGFGTREDAIARVEAAVGRELRDLGWHEVFALARAGAISTRIAVLHERAGQPSMFRVGQDPTTAAALRRIGSSGAPQPPSR